MRTAQNNIEWQNLREAYANNEFNGLINDNDDILLIFEMRKQQSNEI